MAKEMKAAFYESFGDLNNIKIGRLTIPEVKEGAVLVHIKAAGVNPVDAAVHRGYLKDHLPATFPVIPGWDMAGVVEDTGFSARRFKAGDEVYAYARRPVVHFGTFAEYIVIPESYLAIRPKNISWQSAAGIPLVGLTAYQSLYDAGDLQQGQTVLILGASGGVGSMGIQLAKAKGAQVIGVARTKNHAYMKELGADHTIDYKNINVGEEVKALMPQGVDLIFDAVSGETLQQSLIALRPGGRLVSILNHGEDIPADITFRYVFVEPNSSHLADICQLAEARKIKLPVSKTYSLEQTVAALGQIETHHTTGKIVIVL